MRDIEDQISRPFEQAQPPFPGTEVIEAGELAPALDRRPLPAVMGMGIDAANGRISLSSGSLSARSQTMPSPATSHWRCRSTQLDAEHRQLSAVGPWGTGSSGDAGKTRGAA